MSNRFRNVMTFVVGAGLSAVLGLAGYALAQEGSSTLLPAAAVFGLIALLIYLAFPIYSTAAVYRLARKASAYRKEDAELLLRAMRRVRVVPVTRDDRASLLMGNLEAIREVYSRALDDDSGLLSPARLTEALAERGIWKLEDVAAFVRAIQVRNQVVHGDIEEVPDQELTQAVSDTERLLEIQGARSDVGSPNDSQGVV